MLMAIVEEAASPRRYSFCNLTVWIDITTSKVSTTTRRPTIPEIFSESRRLSMNARQSRNSLRILPIMANARMACGDETLVYTPAGTTRSLIAPPYLSGTLSMFTAGGPDNVGETFIASGAPHAQADRLRRRYVRQAQAIGARPDGDVPGIGGRSVCRPAHEAWHSDRPEGRPAQERSARGRNRRKRAQDFSKNQVVTAPFGACNEI